MCGICGWLNLERRLDLRVVKRMNNIARHRGPDDEGYMLVSKGEASFYRGEDSHSVEFPTLPDETPENTFLAFGHRRLSIIDLSVKGHQPMCLENGRVCVTFNGEIYNYMELRRELISKGYSFQSDSDTEVLLVAYEEWGECCVEHLNGMWSFAIWDSDRHRIFCSRDRLGAKPFYYYIDGKNFLFSSELKQLCQNPFISHAMNDEVVATEIMWGIADFSDECWIKSIKVLQGGFNLVLDIGQNYQNINAEVYQYWDIDTFSEKDVTAIARAMNLYRDAVRIRTRSDVPIGIMLSGGVDSSALVVEVSDYFKEIGRAPSEIQTFTSCYENFCDGDESGFAHAVNDYCGTIENFIYPDALDTLSVWEKMIWHEEGTTPISGLGAFMLLKEIGKTGVKVLLNGQGADETMFGYERYYAWYLKDIWERDGVGGFLKEFNQVTANSRLSKITLVSYMIYFLNYSLRKKRNEIRMKKYASSYLMKLFHENGNVRRYISFNNMEDLQYNEIRGTQLAHILHGDDREYMAFSMESRVPFIDYRYIEEAIKIPPHLKIVNGYTKYPLRRHIDGRLPDSVVWRKNKMGWPSPRKRWIERFDKERIRRYLEEPRSERYFNIPSIRRLWEMDSCHYAVERFLNVEIFMRLFNAT